MAITATIPGGLVQLTGNPVIVECAGGSAPVGSSGYMILLKIINDAATLIGAPFTMAIAPDTAGEAIFDISGYVDQPVTAVFQWPLSSYGKNYASQAITISVQPGERYIDSNGDLVTTWGTESDDFQVLKGGLSPRQVAAMRDDSTDFYTEYILGGKWLTARPQDDMVHPTQPVKLWYIPSSDTTGTEFRVKYFFDDGTDATYTATLNLDSAKLYEFNCNPAHLGVNIQPTGKRVTNFTVVLYGESETRRFTYDWNYCERPAFMLFANTFGGVDDVFLSGYIQDKFSTEGDITSRPPQITDTVYTPTLLSLNKQGQNNWVINTGWKSITTIQFYRDLLISKQCWYLYTNISQTTTSIIPVIIGTGDRLLFDRQQDLYSLDIEFSEAHKSRHSFDNRIF